MFKIKNYIQIMKKKGLKFCIIFFIRRILVRTKLMYYYLKIFNKNKKFEFDRQEYNYFYHLYNKSFANERTIEIPIIKRILEKEKGSVLEIGNVLSHYFEIKHDIVDKYERGKNVINEDIIKYNPIKKYDLIICISTLEHIGQEDKTPNKPKKALEKIKTLLKKGGKAYITFPLGYNESIDKIFSEKSEFIKERYLFKKVSIKNDWKQIKPLPVNKKYNYGSCYIGMIIAKN